MLRSSVPLSMLMGPWRPDPTWPDFPSTPSNSTVHVNPGGSGEGASLVVLSSQYCSASCVNSLTWRGHVLNGGFDIIFRTILEYRIQLASKFDKGVHETNNMFFWIALRRRPIPPSRICRDLRGCCQAHSNWRAACSSQAILSKKFYDCAHDSVKLTSFDGNP